MLNGNVSQAYRPNLIPEMIFKGYSTSSEMSPFSRSLGLSIRDRKSKLHLFSDKISEMT